jgi:uncharacterized membrane protein AbrB (regulator of aidB expression)
VTAALVLTCPPGGVAEMNQVALALAIEVPFFTTHHFNRVFLIMAANA